jgi:excisionase family DNA binding protein/PAS domain S-box-containing protein
MESVMEKGFFSTPELAELLGVFHTTVRRWIEQDQIRGFRVGRNYKIPSAEVIRMLDEHGLPLPGTLKGSTLKAVQKTQGLREAVDSSGSILKRLLIVDEIENPALICRRDTILGANQAFAEMMGYTQTDLIGLRLDDLIGQAGWITIRASARRCAEGPTKGPVECTVYVNGHGTEKKKTRIAVSPLGGLKEVFLMVMDVV